VDFSKYQIIGVDKVSKIAYNVEYVLGKYALKNRIEYFKKQLPEANFSYKQINFFPHEETKNGNGKYHR
tara:strand:+ start:107 stop:313 length:207 start_codon:yes stop_codon:yes gene_type:complete